MEAVQSAPAVFRHRGLLLTGLIIAMLFAALDNTIVGTAIPRIVSELNGLSLMTWLTTAYMLTSTTVVPIAGKLADLFGRKLIYVTGIIVFIIGSALCGVAQSMEQLVIFRGIQGIGGGVMMPMAMIIIGDLFTGKQRAKWQGVFGGMFGLASVIGPQIGGWITDHWSWRWVFYINLPVGVLAMFFIAAGLPRHIAKGPVKIDIAGMLAMIAGVVSLLLGLQFGGKEYAWDSWQIIGLFALSIVSLLAFVMIERRASEPILPMHLFRNRTFTIVNSVGFFMSLGMFGAVVFVPLFMQWIVGISASASGTVMMPMMLSLIAFSIIGGQLVYRIGVRNQMLLGMLILGASFILLSTMDQHTTRLIASSYMIVMGVGIGLVMPLLTLVLQESFPKQELGVVTSSSQFFRQIGGTFGITVLGVIMNHKSGTELSAKLTPILQTMTGNLAAFRDKMTAMIGTDPQSVYTQIFNPATLNKIPQDAVTQIVPAVRVTLIDSIHAVFQYGLIFIGAGTILTLFLGTIRLKQRSKEEQQAAAQAAQVH